MHLCSVFSFKLINIFFYNLYTSDRATCLCISSLMLLHIAHSKLLKDLWLRSREQYLQHVYKFIHGHTFNHKSFRTHLYKCIDCAFITKLTLSCTWAQWWMRNRLTWPPRYTLRLSFTARELLSCLPCLWPSLSSRWSILPRSPTSTASWLSTSWPRAFHCADR